MLIISHFLKRPNQVLLYQKKKKKKKIQNFLIRKETLKKMYKKKTNKCVAFPFNKMIILELIFIFLQIKSIEPFLSTTAFIDYLV